MLELPSLWVDPACPVEWAHPLNVGRIGWWLRVPNSGWSGGLTFRDLVRGGRNPHDGILTSGPTWVGNRGRSGGYGSLNCTGGSSVAIPLPAIGSNDHFSLVITHRPTTWPGGFTTLLDDSARNWSLFIDTSGNVSFTGTLLFLGGSLGMTAGSWWQFVAVRNGSAGTLSYYVNGNLITSGSNSVAVAATTVNFGSNSSGGGSNYNGCYDDISLYLNRILTAAEVRAYYEQSRRGHPDTLRWLGQTAWFAPLQAAGGATFQSAWARGSNQWIGPGVWTC
jgi:hypothetical protein